MVEIGRKAAVQRRCTIGLKPSFVLCEEIDEPSIE